MDPRPHSTLGDYRLGDLIGRGGMGTVFRAEHRRIGRTVALKVLREPALAARFLNEARIQAGLRHPHIATLYDYFECDGRACIAMELIEGDTFAERIRQRGALPADEAVTLLRPVVEAVATLHAHGVIHRDLKSHNVKVTREGRVALLDFGIAKDMNLKGLTTGGVIPGTPEYLAPEQVLGRPPNARSDVWALGVLFYELLTGDVPFQAASAFSLFERITRGEYAPPSARRPGTPAWADALVARCLRPSPGDRFASAAEMLRALPGEPHPARPSRAAVGRPASPRRRAFRLPTLRLPTVPSWAPWAFAGLALVLLAAVASTRGRPEPPPPPPPVVRTAPPGAVASDVVIDAQGGPAEVWVDGRLAGETPYTLESWIGEDVKVELRRGGATEDVRFLTTPGKRAYTFTLPSR